jgi:8-oxo-dGTP pyrophosphatase MutT (NUDIX family)
MGDVDSSWYRRPAGVRDRFAAGGVVVRRQAKRTLVALAREADPAHVGYVIPKGGVDAGEDVLTAARREILEETGLHDLVLLGKLGVCYRLTWRRDAWQNIHLFLYVTEQSDGTPTDSRYHEDVWWHPLDDLPPMWWPEQRRLLEEKRGEIEGALARHLRAGPRR